MLETWPTALKAQHIARQRSPDTRQGCGVRLQGSQADKASFPYDSSIHCSSFSLLCFKNSCLLILIVSGILPSSTQSDSVRLYSIHPKRNSSHDHVSPSFSSTTWGMITSTCFVCPCLRNLPTTCSYSALVQGKLRAYSETMLKPL